MEAIEFNEAAAGICEYFGLDLESFLAFAAEDEIGGYPETWPCGSLWAVEGKVLYALVRSINPLNVVEIGTFKGCSATHIAAALAKNGHGTLYCVDPAGNIDLIPDELKAYVKLRGMTHKEFAETNKLRTIDMIFEDVPHDTQTTFEAISWLLPKLITGGVVAIHDACHFLVGEEVSAGVSQAVGDFNKVLIAPADCGLGYWKKP